MIIILVVAAVISLLLKDSKDAIAIFSILVLNASLGFLQDYRAERAMSALQRLTVPSVRVRRNGRVQEIPAPQLAPGDIVLLEAGVLVPADCRIIESAALQVQESALTGESVAVDKISEALHQQDLPLGDRRNMVYRGTSVTYGRGIGVVTATGMRTELGRIADLIQQTKTEQTPLQRRLNQFGKKLAIIVLGIIAILLVLELLRGTEVRLVLLTAISMAVAAIPEGLPAIVTIALALGAQRMLRQRALIRKLPAVETLGSVTVICSDKTGTLTENKMTATAIVVGNQRTQLLGGEAVHPSGRFLLTCAALCNDAVIPHETVATRDTVIGDPTEVGLIVAAYCSNIHKRDLDERFPRVYEIPFSSERKLMTTVHGVHSNRGPAATLEISSYLLPFPYLVVTKGAVDKVLGLCSSAISGEHIVPFSDNLRSEIYTAQNELAADGMRVLGLAYRSLENLDSTEDVESSMVFIGLVSMIDPPRSEARHAVASCKEAGIRTVMITGDHPLTALTIARSLGICRNSTVLTGRELDTLSSDDLRARVAETSVFARVSPEHKLSIVKALQAQGNVVAMTGDGVNDAPALKAADIGVAMGKVGTDVAKESADMVLLDDNFTTIVSAIREGRVIYQNILKSIKYLMTTNYAEMFVMVVAPLVGMPLPLLPLQILWLNLITDGPPALALGVEPAEADVMTHPPRDPRASIFSDGMGRHIAWVGTLMGAISLGNGYWYWTSNSDHWQTMVFITLTLCQLAHVLAIRSGTTACINGDLLSNTFMVSAVSGTFLLALAVLYTPTLQDTFSTHALSTPDLSLCLLGAIGVLLAIECEKWIVRRRMSTQK
jgi:Ca2+-transporting ATPase